MSKEANSSEFLATTERADFTRAEAKYLRTLPSIEDDPGFQSCCQNCRNEKEKQVPYSECADCLFLSRQTLREIVLSLECNDREVCEIEARELAHRCNNPGWDKF